VFGSIGAPELIFIFLIALLVFGPRKLPQLGRAIGRSLGEFRRATQDLKSSLEREVTEEEIGSPEREPVRDDKDSDTRDEGQGGGPE
jgi:TatA/E family protein of Tat protein translocase